MLLPINWLNDYIDTGDISAQELGERLTMLSHETEDIINKAKDISKVYIGKIESLEKHPDADKLNVCQVRVFADEEPRQIVCGAPNVYVGMFVPASIVGAELPGGFKIKQSKIRGVDSFGMLCSEVELGISDEAEGIMDLPKDLDIGDEFTKVMGLDNDILDIGILPNRGDCMSVIGLAREVSVMLDKKLKLPEVTLKEEIKEEIKVSVEVKDKDLCPRYMAKVVKGVKIGPSPKWMVERLEAAGIRSINNIVDVTNFVLLEMGQPLHAFDYHKIKGNKIIIRKANESEKIMTLDEEERALSSEMLAICDVEKPIAVAGVMGGANSEICNETQDILIEAAYFDPVSIRRTSVKLALSSESSSRFVKGIDYKNIERALYRAAQLMCDLAGGTAVSGHIDEYDNESDLNVDNVVEIDYEKISKVLGLSIDKETIVSNLIKLGLTVDGDKVTAPSWRKLDISRFEDIVEEVIRIYGMDKLPCTLPGKQVVINEPGKVEVMVKISKDTLVGCGLNETLTYSMISPDDQAKLLLDDIETFNLANPISREESVMRPQIISSLLKTATYNQKRQNNDLKIFEVGRTYNKDKDGKPYENIMVAGLLMGTVHQGILSNAARKQDSFDFFYLKGIVENLIDEIGIKRVMMKPSACKAFHPGRSADLNVGKDVVARIAQIHPDVAGNFDLKGEVFYFEVNITLASKFASFKKKYKSLPKFPSSRRDTTMWVKEDINYGKVMEVINKSASKLLVDVELIDIYKGDNAHGDDYHNLTYALYFQSPNKTLTEEEINADFDKIIKGISAKVGAKFG